MGFWPWRDSRGRTKAMFLVVLQPETPAFACAMFANDCTGLSRHALLRSGPGVMSRIRAEALFFCWFQLESRTYECTMSATDCTGSSFHAVLRSGPGVIPGTARKQCF